MNSGVSDRFARQFLFAVMAVDRGLINRDAFMAAVNGWSFDKSVPLADQFIRLNAMNQAVALELEAIIDQHMKEHGGDLARCLDVADTSVRKALAQALAAIPDDEIRKCVDLLNANSGTGQPNEPARPRNVGDTQVVEPERIASPLDSESPADHAHVASNDATEEARIKRRSGRVWPRPMFQAGRFAAVRPIGGDGMGLIYIGYDRDEIGRIVAIKTIQNENQGKRLRLEGEIHGQLEHPNILPVYGTGVTAAGSPFIALQYIRKGDLRKAIRNFHAGMPILPTDAKDSPYDEMFRDPQDPRFDDPDLNAPDPDENPAEANPAAKRSGTGGDVKKTPIAFDKLRGERLSDFNDLLRRFTDICNAIEYAHDRGVLHRDLKPGNVMLGNHGETFVIDWGVAKLLDDPKADEEERIDQVIVNTLSEATRRDFSPGTTLYMAPEQLIGANHRVDRRTDTFALGLILCEILTGNQPFFDRIQTEFAALTKQEQADRVRSMLADAIRQGPPDLRLSNRSIPRPLAAICRKALAFEQADRYQTARELAEEVNRWLADEPVKAYRDAEGRIEKAARWTRKNRVRAAAMMASLVFVALGSIVVATLLQILANQRFEAERQEKLAAGRALRDAQILAETEKRAEAERRYADSQATLKLARSRGAWKEAIRTIDDLENQIRTSNRAVTPEERIDLRLDRLDALDGASLVADGMKLAEELEAEAKQSPDRFDARRRGRLYLHMGDLFPERRSPEGETYFEMASKQTLSASERNYVQAYAEPDPKKAIAFLDAATSEDPYNVRAVVMSTSLRILTNDIDAAMNRLAVSRAIMPADNSLLALSLTIESVARNRKPDQADRDRIIEAFGAGHGKSLLNMLDILAGRENVGLIPLSGIVKSLGDARKGPQLYGGITSLVVNPPASLIPLRKLVDNMMNEPWNVFETLKPRNMIESIGYEQVMRTLRKAFRIPEKGSAARIEDYRQARKIYGIPEIAIFEAHELSVVDDASGMVQALESLAEGGSNDHMHETRVSAMFMANVRLYQKSFAWLSQNRNPVGPDGVATEPMRKSIRKLMQSAVLEDRAFDAFQCDFISQLASLIDDDELAVLFFTNQMRIAPDGLKATYLRLHKASSDPFAMMDVIKNPPGGLKGDIWTALRVRIHRYYPGLVKNDPTLNDMPENPFQPISVDHPLPIVYNIHYKDVPTLKPVP